MTEKQKPSLHAIDGDRAKYEYEQAQKLVKAILIDDDPKEADAIVKASREKLAPRGKLTEVTKK